MANTGYLLLNQKTGWSVPGDLEMGWLKPDQRSMRIESFNAVIVRFLDLGCKVCIFHAASGSQDAIGRVQEQLQNLWTRGARAHRTESARQRLGLWSGDTVGEKDKVAWSFPIRHAPTNKLPGVLRPAPYAGSFLFAIAATRVAP
jgi:hypothetical protein